MQGAHGGWPLFQDGAFNISASVKAYFALKMIGDDIDAPHMARAREAIFAHGGAAKSNVFTRALLALYGEIPWRGVPVMPVEIMLLPKWFPFHLDKVSYWARTVLVPLLVLMTKKPRAKNRLGHSYRRTLHDAAGRGARVAQGRTSDMALDAIFSARSTSFCCFVEPYFPKGLARSRDRTRRKPGRRSDSMASTDSARSSRPWSTAC